MCVRDRDSVITLYSGQLNSIDSMQLNLSIPASLPPALLCLVLTLTTEIYPFVTSQLEATAPRPDNNRTIIDGGGTTT